MMHWQASFVNMDDKKFDVAALRITRYVVALRTSHVYVIYVG